MKVIICGAGGFIGQYLVRDLLKLKENEIYGIDIGFKRESIQKKGCKIVEFDITKSVEEQKIEGFSFDTAVFLAQSPDYRDMPQKVGEVYKINVVGLANFLEFSRRCGVQHFIYASSGSVYYPVQVAVAEEDLVAPNNLYALSKLQGEQLIEQYTPFFKTSIMRFFTVYGPGQKNMLVANIVARVRDGQPVIIHSREDNDMDGFITTPCHVEDAVRVMKFFIQNRITGIFNIAGSEEISIRRIVEISAKLLEKKPIIQIEVQENRANLIADTTRLKTYYKFPFVTFEQGMQSVVKAI